MILENTLTVLKSNMDRFIELNALPNDIPITILKSNMDRFIDITIILFLIKSLIFKIQYG